LKQALRIDIGSLDTLGNCVSQPRRWAIVRRNPERLELL